MKRKVRLNELMAVSGGFTERASGTIQILHTEPLMCPEPGGSRRGADRRHEDSAQDRKDLQTCDRERSEANPVIRPGDYVE